MRRRTTISRRRKTGGTVIGSVANTFSDKERLELFRTKANELFRCPLLREGFKAQLSIHFMLHGPVTLSEKNVDEHQLRECVSMLRPFILKGEFVFIDRIANICMCRLASDELKTYLEKAKTRWKDSVSRGPFELVIQDRKYTPGHVLDLLLNGCYSHFEPAKVRELNSIIGLARPPFRHIFQDYIVEALKYIYCLVWVVNVGLRENQFNWR